MNENIDLTKILKDCPAGTKLYSTVYGEVEFIGISNGEFPIKYVRSDDLLGSATAQGLLLSCFDGECTLFPSKEQRDWSKFTAPWADEHPANVWHEASEEPIDNSQILYQDRLGVCWTASRQERFEYDWDWERFAFAHQMLRWAYISDLLPKGGEK